MLSQIGAGFGTATAGALMLFALYATVKTRGGALRALPKTIRLFQKSTEDHGQISSFRAFATSLAGTIGVGNMTGVALAITLGGPGAVFWMWISALLCLSVKQFEIYLAQKEQPKEEETYGIAPMIYIKKATESNGFAALFAIFGLFSALTMGSMIQTSAAATAANEAFFLPSWTTAALFALGVCLSLSGGIGRRMKSLEKTLPVLGLAFLLIASVVLIFRYRQILPALKEIFTNAFSLSSATGGFLGSGFALAFRHGVGNGLFSHEAGLGSAGLAHGACKTDPKEQSLWGIFEVFFDTAVISTLCALMMLTTEEGPPYGVLAAVYTVMGPLGRGLIALCLLLFAFLSVLSWSYYGECCFFWLAGGTNIGIYRLLYCISPLLALLADESTLWASAEIINGGMMVFNLTALVGFRDELNNLYPKKQKHPSKKRMPIP